MSGIDPTVQLNLIKPRPHILVLVSSPLSPISGLVSVNDLEILVVDEYKLPLTNTTLLSVTALI